jgi:hypothetical protein
MPVMQISKKFRRIFDIGVGVEHCLDGGKILAMEVLVDLHATNIYQLGARLPGSCELLQCSIFGRGKEGFSLDVESVGIERSPATCFRQADRIENALRNSIFGSGGLDLTLAETDRRCLGARDRRCQSDRAQSRQKCRCPRTRP